jgi:hypothetical protein
MNDVPKARPVSGEIMADRAAPAAASVVRPGADVVDAEFETVTPDAARPLRAPGFVAPGIDSAAAAISGLGVLKRPDMPVDIRRPGGPVFWTFGLCLAAAAFWVSGGHTLLPQVHLPAFLRQAPTLRIASVHTRIEKIDGHAILFVDGSATNETGRTIEVPPLSINVEGDKGRTTRFFLGTRDRQVAAGETFDFSSRLELPRDGATSVSVSFDR